ncbi:histidine kinase [uncultured Microbulbifer sp.]|uniref:sensor histidine kinase n=1 Tax=uncultured Microbulbifer sp. TaxID=348147 RepID=UPI00261A1681|nr:histidine kinase [uncultured Microbulbifer sp.]
MRLLKSPTLTAKFLTYHFGGWLLFSLINALSLGLLTQDHFDKITIHIATVAFTVGLSTLGIREIIWRLNLFDKNWQKQWIYFIATSTILGFICACISVSFIYVYYNLVGHTVPSSFWGGVLDNWLFLIILMITWTLVYFTIVNQDRLHKAKEDATQLKLQLNEVKMSALMGQLNPHFLFNGLNNIRALILEDKQKSRAMLTNLSDLLRYTLMAHKQNAVSLRDELEIVCQYIELLKIQYEDRLIFRLDIDQNLMAEKIPPLLIQLLAENAVRHGIEKTKKGGVLTLKASKDNNHMHITVTNPGNLKKSTQKISTDRVKPVKKDENSNTGLGLINIKNRLAIQYGEQSNFKIEQQGLNVVAQCQIPISIKQEVV